ncbi:progesterone receptor isoform X1 [Pelobates fuscus]|uniref:progesterone receptor isoform X1 n=2 Tax=Pelobates fuscus TaxID=191477 RepID=UPI002FE4C1CE
MENIKERSKSSSHQPCSNVETTSRSSAPRVGFQVDPLREVVSDQSALSLERLLCQKSEDQESYQKGEGQTSSDNNELQNVLDSILGSSTPGHIESWSDLIGPEIASILNTSPKVRTPTGHPPDHKEVSIWAEVTLAETKGAQESKLSKGKGKASMEEVNVKTDIYEEISTSPPSFPPELNVINMPGLSINPTYLVTRTRQIFDVEGPDQGSLSPSISQQLLACTYPSSSTKQISYFHHTEAKIKKEEDGTSSMKATIDLSGPGYGLSLQKCSNPDPDKSLDFNMSVYDSYGPSHGRAADSPTHLLPTTSVAPQNLYQPLSLNSHQQLLYQSTLKDNYLPQIQLPYVQYIRTDSEPDQSSSYSYETLPQKKCLICGDEASGCHYGVLTCGSCKVFFKRAIEGQHNYLCAGRNDCIIDKIRRKNCPSCRLRKCCQAGMILGGRKFKKFSRIKAERETDAIVLQQPMVIPMEYQQVLTRRMSNSTQEIQYVPELLQILQSIEPEVVYAGYDNTQPETPSALLSSLNQLCERQLMCVVKWSKSLPGFKMLHIDDQITLLQYSWMSLMVFAMGWRSYKHVSGQMLYFAPDLILNEQRMKDSSFYSLCLSMWQLPQEFVKLQVTHEEFLCMKALLLLNTIPLEGLKSQSHFDDMRSNYIRELAKAINLRHKGVVASSQRFYNLTKIMDSMHDLVKQLHLYCLNTFLQSRALSVEFPEMMSEVISAQLPKILAGMVKPLIFHKKSGDCLSADKG